MRLPALRFTYGDFNRALIVDDASGDPRLQFFGDWYHEPGVLAVLDGTLSSGIADNSSLVFTFEGTAVAVVGAYASHRTSSASLYAVDGIWNTTFPSLTFNDFVVNYTYFSVNDLPPGQHTLVVNVTQGSEAPYFFDYVAYQPLPPVATSSSMSSSAISSASSSSASPAFSFPPITTPLNATATTHDNPRRPIIIGVAAGFGTCLLILVLASGFLFFRKWIWVWIQKGIHRHKGRPYRISYFSTASAAEMLSKEVRSPGPLATVFSPSISARGPGSTSSSSSSSDPAHAPEVTVAAPLAQATPPSPPPKPSKKAALRSQERFVVRNPDPEDVEPTQEDAEGQTLTVPNDLNDPENLSTPPPLYKSPVQSGFAQREDGLRHASTP